MPSLSAIRSSPMARTTSSKTAPARCTRRLKRRAKAQGGVRKGEGGLWDAITNCAIEPSSLLCELFGYLPPCQKQRKHKLSANNCFAPVRPLRQTIVKRVERVAMQN